MSESDQTAHKQSACVNKCFIEDTVNVEVKGKRHTQKHNTVLNIQISEVLDVSNMKGRGDKRENNRNSKNMRCYFSAGIRIKEEKIIISIE